jgi:hypothetical protein
MQVRSILDLVLQRQLPLQGEWGVTVIFLEPGPDTSFIPDAHGNLLQQGNHGIVLISDDEKLP